MTFFFFLISIKKGKKINGARPDNFESKLFIAVV